jgi:hypothetical protein
MLFYKPVHPNSTQQEANYIYLYTTKFGTSIKIRVNRIRDNESQLYYKKCMLLKKKYKIIITKYLNIACQNMCITLGLKSDHR